jgi:hypothetical protein
MNNQDHDPTDESNVEQTGEVSLARRGFANLLALVGGGAALAACVGEDKQGPLGAAVSEVVRASPNFWVDNPFDLKSVLSPTGYAFVYGTNNLASDNSGVFIWLAGAPPATLPEDLGIIVHHNSGTGYWRRLYSGPINVQWFRDKVVGSDWAPAFRAAVAAANSTTISPQGAVIYVPAGNYALASKDATWTAYNAIMVVTRGNVRFVGDGASSLITYAFANAATCITFDLGPGTGALGQTRILNCGVRGLSFVSNSGINFQKKAIRIANGDNFLLEDIVVSTNWRTSTTNGNANPSMAVEILGGQGMRVRNLYAQCDQPITIGPVPVTNDASGRFVDQLSMACMNLGVDDLDKAAIFIDKGAPMTNINIKDTSTSQGRYGIFWNTWSGSASTINHFNVDIQDVRVERLTRAANTNPSAAASLVIAPLDPATGLPPTMGSGIAKNVTVQNFACAIGQISGQDPEGMYFRNVTELSILNGVFSSISRPAINLNGTCDNIRWDGCFFGAGANGSEGGAVMTPGLTLVSATPQSSNTNFYNQVGSAKFPRATPNAVYVNSSGAGASAYSVNWEARGARYVGSLAVGGTFTIPVLFSGAAHDWDCAIITVAAHGPKAAAVATAEGGIFMAVRGATVHAIKRMGGTSNCFDSGLTGLVVNVPGGSHNVALFNFTGIALTYIVTVDFKLYAL